MAQGRRRLTDNSLSCAWALFYNSANRNETVSADPGRFDITRSPHPHVGFGGPRTRMPHISLDQLEPGPAACINRAPE